MLAMMLYIQDKEISLFVPYNFSSPKISRHIHLFKWTRVRSVPLVVNTSRSFPHSWLTTGYVTRVTRWVPLIEQELPTLPEHLSSPQVFSGVRVTLSLVFCVMFCRLLFVLLSFYLLATVLSVLQHIHVLL